MASLSADLEQQQQQQSTVTDTDVEKSVPSTVPDPDVVDFEGPDDPMNPLNWTTSKKTVVVSLVSILTLLSSLSSSVFAPGIPQVIHDFGSNNTSLGSFTLTVFVIGYAFGPLGIAPLSEIYGRTPVYIVSCVFFVIFTICCAIAPSLASLIVFRLLAGFAGSCPLALGAGTVADVVRPESRGIAMAAYTAGPLLGPIIGPIGGGYLIQAQGWRWSFWVVSMAAGLVLVFTVLFLDETYKLTILNKKTKKLRKETGNENLRSVLHTDLTHAQVFRIAIVRPTKMLFMSPIIFSLSLFMFILYGYFYLMFTAIPGLFQNQYGFSPGQVGLTYLGLGVGSFVGLLLSGATSDRLVVYLKEKKNTEPKPEYRLPVLIAGTCLVPIGLFWIGWTAQTLQHWILPTIGTGIVSVGVTLLFMASTTYLIDVYTTYAASAVAASVVLRSLGGALLPLAGGPMFERLGLGWGNSLLAFIGLLMIPVPIAFYLYGERIRQKEAKSIRF